MDEFLYSALRVIFVSVLFYFGKGKEEPIDEPLNNNSI
jgi:hypothetical protein